MAAAVNPSRASISSANHPCGEPENRESRLMQALRLCGVIVGVVVITLLIRQVGWKQLEQSLGMLGWAYGIVLVYPLIWIILNTTGWRFAFHAQYSHQPFFRLAQIRLAGEAFNSMLPSGYVGGEPLKARLLSRWIPIHEAASSIFIAKAAQSIALVLFVGIGLTFGTRRGQVKMAHHPKTFLALVLLSIGIFIFTLLLTRRTFSRLGRWLQGLIGHPWLQKQEPKLIALDDSIGAFYRECKGRFIISVFWHFAGWVAGAFEVAVIFYLIGHTVTWREAWFIGSMAQLAAIVGLLSPAGIGLYEGGHYLAAAALGLPPELGVTVALIRRVREIFWDMVGIGIFWKYAKVKLEPPAA